MRRCEPGWLLALRIILVCSAAAFTLGVAVLSLTFQPYVLVVAHNLSGASVTLDLGIEGSAMGSRHVGRGGWSLGVLKVGRDTDVYVICRSETGSPLRTESGLYVTSNMQQLLVADVKRCDRIEVDSHGMIDPLVWFLSRFRN